MPELVSCLTLRNFIFMPLGPTRAAWLNATIFRENFANASRKALLQSRNSPSVMREREREREGEEEEGGGEKLLLLLQLHCLQNTARSHMHTHSI
uniref:Secreted protein n=1 Tax=Trichogramma kaykai TaxID=54128 RepID=A0ABD2VRU8_9HYME